MFRRARKIEKIDVNPAIAQFNELQKEAEKKRGFSNIDLYQELSDMMRRHFETHVGFEPDIISFIKVGVVNFIFNNRKELKEILDKFSD